MHINYSSNECSNCQTSKARITNTEFRSICKLFHRYCSTLVLVRVHISSRRGLQSYICRSIIYGCTRDAHGGRNQWVWSLAQSTIKRKILVDQEIKGCLKTGSSDQEQNLVIKNFDRRRRWKYRVHSGDYIPLVKARAQAAKRGVLSRPAGCTRTAHRS